MAQLKKIEVNAVSLARAMAGSEQTLIGVNAIELTKGHFVKRVCTYFLLLYIYIYARTHKHTHLDILNEYQYLQLLHDILNLFQRR